jgi:serine/threonine-protein kinase
MLAADGQLRVLDFGIAALLDVNTAALTQAHMVLGTVAYMAPEQARGERADASADIYSLGCVLMAMTTGQPPFTADHPMGLITAHMSSPAPRLAERRPDAPADLDHLVAEMLAKDPRDRPSSADAVEHTLETILSRLQPDLVVPTAAMLATTVEILGASQPAEPAQRTVSMPPSPPLSDGALDPTVVMPSRSDKPRRRRTWILLAVSALVLTLLGLWILTRGSESAPVATATQSPGPSPSVSVAATTIPDGIARLRAAVGAAAESGNLDESGAGELDALIDNFPTSASGASQMSWVPSSAPLVTTAKGDKGSKVKPDKKPGPGKPTAPKSDPAQTVSQQLDYFSARVTGLADEGRLTMAGEAPVRVALDELRVLYRA